MQNNGLENHPPTQSLAQKRRKKDAQQINQLALPKTFEIDFKFFGPLFLYATKGQFFISNDNNKSNTRSFSWWNTLG